MPRMDGIEVCRLIRSKVLCPILCLTARVDEDDKINVLLSGGDDYITKPFSLRELEARAFIFPFISDTYPLTSILNLALFS